MAKAFIVALAAFMLTACNGGAANTGNNSNAFKADMASTGSKSNGKTTVVWKATACVIWTTGYKSTN